MLITADQSDTTCHQVAGGPRVTLGYCRLHHDYNVVPVRRNINNREVRHLMGLHFLSSHSQIQTAAKLTKIHQHDQDTLAWRTAGPRSRLWRHGPQLCDGVGPKS